MDVGLEGSICAVSSLAKKVARVAAPGEIIVVDNLNGGAGDGGTVAEGWKPKENVRAVVAVMVP